VDLRLVVCVLVDSHPVVYVLEDSRPVVFFLVDSRLDYHDEIVSVDWHPVVFVVDWHRVVFVLVDWHLDYRDEIVSVDSHLDVDLLRLKRRYPQNHCNIQQLQITVNNNNSKNKRYVDVPTIENTHNQLNVNYVVKTNVDQNQSRSPNNDNLIMHQTSKHRKIKPITVVCEM
jgi:hypothetical protein